MYRLTGDVKWPVSTPFSTALGNLTPFISVGHFMSVVIGSLAGLFPLLSLRTNKADIAVGIPQDIADKLDEKDKGWRVNGK